MKVNTTKAKRCLKRFYRIVIIRTCHIWGTLLVIFLALLAPYLFKYFNADFWNPDFHIRASGFILQFLFVIVVLIDIREIMKFFDRPSPLQSLKKWWEDVKSICSKETLHASYSAATNRIVISGSGDGSVKHTGLELEERVELLEKELQDYITTANEKIKTIETDIYNLLKELNKEKRQRELELKRVDENLRKIFTDGLKLEGAALVWLVAGLIFSIFPSELVSILNYL